MEIFLSAKSSIWSILIRLRATARVPPRQAVETSLQDQVLAARRFIVSAPDLADVPDPPSDLVWALPHVDPGDRGLAAVDG